MEKLCVLKDSGKREWSEQENREMWMATWGIPSRFNRIKCNVSLDV